MAEVKTIIIAEISEKNGWYNIKSNKGEEISCMKEKCPKLAAVLANAKPGDEATGKLVEKNGKFYLWDPDENKGSGGGKSFAPKDKSLEAAHTAATAAAQMLFGKAPTTEQFDVLFEHIHTKIMSKKSA